ncbi:5-(carboxyamino)imidazole ribonucleotide synthase [Paremcibacter congregatus]|uniref:N5-carboxyaminoimidazole ribonucleotide synthase n=1 Tax=Paremcibacter congregatus TaxID=2043170 RepID=A0A2G4YRF2_9PROT|nr:5-(carboxyamino)imidazole ribonucleotide synthase [Paremcibacter congregatus]PHZ84911.1 5-(carboxyamino)imidazole ribonucleotide synthase [Paremcibacter congregatus]QDE26115.1 5-(carboxyamino)imidazole ribonucleotide synthase [Paremcibacter congregatus]
MKTCAPGSVIGMLGGGQLGRMLALAAAQLGYHTHVYCPDEKNPAEQVTDRLSRNSYTDEAALVEFGKSVDVVTYEFENIPVETVELLQKHVPVFPSAKVLKVSQDRLREKDFLNGIGIETAPYAPVATVDEAAIALRDIGYPAVLKTRRFGYDGKGQAIVRQPTDLLDAWASLKSSEIIIEGFIPFDMEISVLAARGQDGEIRCFDPAENIHKNHILDLSIAPARIAPELRAEAIEIARRIVAELDYVGVLAVEFFVSGAAPVFRVNEIAPRVHNSGHWSIEACPTSQFEQHIRAICGLPLGDTTLYGRTEMKNLIGDDILDMESYLKDPAANFHHYGKKQAHPGRKMGHVTWVYPDAASWDD